MTAHPLGRCMTTADEVFHLTHHGHRLALLPGKFGEHLRLGGASATILRALADLRDPDGAPTRRRAEAVKLAAQHRPYVTGDRLRIPHVYDADLRATAPEVALLATQLHVQHPVDGATYADGAHRSRLPWRKMNP